MPVFNGNDVRSAAIEINCAFLASWDTLKLYERDQKKSDLAHQIVSVNLPSIAKIDAFFKASANHINKLIAANFGIAQDANQRLRLDGIGTNDPVIGIKLKR